MRRGSLALMGLAVLASAAGALPGAGEAAIEIAPVEAKAAAGRGVRLTLSADVAPSWREANVGFTALRSPGLQKSLDTAAAAGRELEVALPAAGCALLVADLGRPEDRGFSDSWRRSRRSVKAVLCQDAGDPAADLAARRRSAALLMARAGTRDEVRPLANPATTRPGADLPLRLYADGDVAAGVEVVAEGPGGTSTVTRSDAHGFAAVALPAAGRWRIHFRPAPDRVAELLFEVPERRDQEASR